MSGFLRAGRVAAVAGVSVLGATLSADRNTLRIRFTSRRAAQFGMTILMWLAAAHGKRTELFYTALV